MIWLILFVLCFIVITYLALRDKVPTGNSVLFGFFGGVIISAVITFLICLVAPLSNMETKTDYYEIISVRTATITKENIPHYLMNVKVKDGIYKQLILKTTDVTIMEKNDVPPRIEWTLRINNASRLWFTLMITPKEKKSDYKLYVGYWSISRKLEVN